MKQNQKCTLKPIVWALLGLCVLFSCSDIDWIDQSIDGKQGKKSKHRNEEMTIDVAKQWYEAYYDPVVTTRSSKSDTTQSKMMPYWEKAKELNRQRYEVVELPLKTRGGHLVVDSETAQKWDPSVQNIAIRNTTKMVIERDKETGRTRAFIMIFVGSYDYLNKTRSMGKNSYLYREPDFDGSVMFYELNGSFVNGWKYKDGKIVATIAPTLNDELEEKGPQTRGMSCSTTCYRTYIGEECFESSWSSGDMETGFSFGVSVRCYDRYNTECHEVCDYYDDYDYYDDEDDWDQPDDPPGGSQTTYPPPPPPVDDVLPPLLDPKRPLELMDRTKFVGWYGDANCLTLAQETLKKYGITNYGSSANVFRLVEEKNGLLSQWGSDPLTNYENAIKCIDDHLNASRPIIVGVHHTPFLDFNEGTTDHFVVVTGRGFDPLLQKPYYTFMENATSSRESGCSDSNRFYYTIGNLSGTSDYMEKYGKKYTVSQVRPNNGETYATTTAYK